MEKIIQDKINEYLIQIRALELKNFDKIIEDKEKELNLLKLERSNVLEEANALKEEGEFLEKMFIRYKELKTVE